MSTSISFPVERPISQWEKEDIAQAIAAIMEKRSFFYAGDDNLGDEVRAFLVDHPIYSNIELVEDDLS
jgi:hypothetical protein